MEFAKFPGGEEGKVKPGRQKGGGRGERRWMGQKKSRGTRTKARRRAFEKNGKMTFGRRGHVLTLKFAEGRRLTLTVDAPRVDATFLQFHFGVLSLDVVAFFTAYRLFWSLVSVNQL